MTMTTELAFIDRLREGYEAAKKPIAYILVITAVVLETVPFPILPDEVRQGAFLSAVLALTLVLLEILFTIYEKTTEERELKVIKSNEVYNKIVDIIGNERSVNIKYIGVAGRHGWEQVLAKLLSEQESNSLIANRKKFEIDVAFLNPEFKSINKRLERLYKKFAAVGNIAEKAEDLATYVGEEAPSDAVLRVHYYDHMPNILGFLVNDNYLFVTYAFWEYEHGELTLKAGGSNYFVYDKNDEFGGQEVIRRFLGWYEFILDTEEQPALIAEGSS